MLKFAVLNCGIQLENVNRAKMNLFKAKSNQVAIKKSEAKWLLLSFLGAGYAPFAPGTVGTAAAIPFVLVLNALLGRSLVGISFYILIFFALFFISSLLANQAQKETRMLDDGRIVIDEVLGFMLTMFLIPLHWKSLMLGFFLFRLVDILKPWPASWADKKVKNGWGVILDDIFAAFYSWLAMYLIFNTFKIL